jgi:hypothetical protein
MEAHYPYKVPNSINMEELLNAASLFSGRINVNIYCIMSNLTN